MHSSTQYQESARLLLEQAIQNHSMIYDGTWMDNIWKRMDISPTQAISQCLEDGCESLVGWLDCVSEDHEKDLCQRHIDIIMGILSVLLNSKTVSMEKVRCVPSHDVVKAQEDQVGCAMAMATMSMSNTGGKPEVTKMLIDSLVGLCACHLDRLKWFENALIKQSAEAQKAHDTLRAIKQLLNMRVTVYSEKVERATTVLQQLEQDMEDRYADLCAVAVKSRAQLQKSGESKNASAYLAFEEVILSRDPHVLQLVQAKSDAVASGSQQAAVLTRMKKALATFKSLRSLCECVAQEREQVVKMAKDQLLFSQFEALHQAENKLLRSVPVLTDASLEYCRLKLSHRAKAQDKLSEQLSELGNWFDGWRQNAPQAERWRMENCIRTLKAASDASESMVIQVVESQQWMWTVRRELLPMAVVELVDEGIAKLQMLKAAAETPPNCGVANDPAASQLVRSFLNRTSKGNKRTPYSKPNKEWRAKLSGFKHWDSEFFG